MNKRPIGVFDSGIGGLNVLKSLIKQFPSEDFIYLADTKNCPYGTKSPAEIKALIKKTARYLIQENCKAIVIACNTATARAAELFELSEPIVLGVIYPTANAAIQNSKRIAVLATDSTISSGVYQDILLRANLEVFPVKSSKFVPLIESGNVGTSESFRIVFEHLEYLKNEEIDTVILGCTHFALIEAEVQAVFSNSRIINSGFYVSKELEKLLKKQSLLNKQAKGNIYLKTTGEIGYFSKQIEIFDLQYKSLEKIYLD